MLFLLKRLRKQKLKKGSNINPADAKEILDRLPAHDYESISARIKQAGKKHKSILFASVEPAALPVTISVNVAIRLAKSSKRCLLVDLDLRRDAVAKVFELDAESGDLCGKAVETEFANLWVWPAHNFTEAKQMNIRAIVEKALDKFDFILINAPSVLSSADRRQIISAGQAAFLCIKDMSEAAQLSELMKPLGCAVIGHIQIAS